MEAAQQLQGSGTTTVNVEKLRKELWAARREEETYQRENDAKFRAIRQNVASYEEFRCVRVRSVHEGVCSCSSVPHCHHDHHHQFILQQEYSLDR